MNVRIYITLKKGVLDPQGKTVEDALHTMGFDEAHNLRIGKYMEMELNGSSREEAECRVRDMCEKLLANPVIEDYRFEIDEK